ncbi:MAG: ParB/RepB/Spo0J family partition protein [Pseudomonadota bacterium]
MPIELIHPNPDQPRRRFSDDELDELAASIRERGVIQPVVLRPHPDKDKQYQIVAGERRWRAAQRAGLHALPAVVREIDDRTMLEVAIVENVQRQDLNPIEEAEGYQALIARFGYTQEALAKIVGKSRSHLANTLRLAALPDEVRALVVAGSLSAGHARALIGVEGAETLARKIVADGLSVRQVEALVKAQAGGAKRPTKAVKDGAAKDADTRMLEADLSAAIGMTTVLAPKADGSGEVRIRYQDLDDLDRLCELLSQ